MRTFSTRYGVKFNQANGWEHRCTARATAHRCLPTHQPTAQHTHENNKQAYSSSEDAWSQEVDRTHELRAESRTSRARAGPPAAESSQPERIVCGWEKDFVYLLADDIRNARFVVDIRNLRGLYREWLVDQPRLVVDMLYRLQNLKTPTGADRSALIKEEAQELLLLISFESLLDPRILCRALASTWRVRAVPTETMLDAIYHAMRSGLDEFNLHNTVGSSGLFTCIAWLFPGSSRFDEDLDTALQRVLHHQQSRKMTVRQHSQLLWALARIGFQNSTVETIIRNCCIAIAREANKELEDELTSQFQHDPDANHSVSSNSSTSQSEGSPEVKTHSQEEEELVKASGFDLSWLPGGAPEHSVILQAPLNSRLAAGRFIDIDAALTSSSDLPEASSQASEDISDAVLGGTTVSTPRDQASLDGTSSSTPSSAHDNDVYDSRSDHSTAAEAAGKVQGRVHDTESPIRTQYTTNATTSSSSRSSARSTDQSAPLQHETTTTTQVAAAAQRPTAPNTQPHEHQESTEGSSEVKSFSKAEASQMRGRRRQPVRQGTFVEKHGQQTLSNTVWALATFEAEGLEGVHDAIAACCQLYCAMPPQDVYLQVAANMAWASNHHGVHKASVLHHTAACVHQMNPNPQQTRTKPQSVSNILYAMAEARYRDLDTIKNLTLWATVHIGLFNDQERANLAWACARLNYSNRELFQALRPHVVAYVAESEAWLNQVHHTALPKRRVSSMCAVLGQFLWGYSLLGHLDGPLFHTICRPLATLGKIRTQAAAEAPPHPQSAPSTTTRTDILDHLGETILTQVATAWMSLEVIGEHVQLQDNQGQAEGDINKELVQNALSAMRREAHKTVRSHSAVHDSICEVLQVLGVPYQRNVLLQNELLCIQTLVGLEGAEPVAIVLNRGHDLTITRPLEVVGNAAWQATQLRARGVRVVEVNGDSWRHLSIRQRAAHLQHLLSPFAVQ